jgi:hypothetical protein
MSWTEPMPGLVLNLLLPVYMVTVVTPLLTKPSPADISDSHWPAAPPLYISQCSFVI